MTRGGTAAATSQERRASREHSEWPLVRLGDVCEIQLGKMLSPKSKNGRDPQPYLRNANVQWGRFDLRDVSTMDFDAREKEKFLLRPGDLLVCEGGEPGRCAVWDGSIQPCYYQKALHRIRSRDDALDTEFLMYRLWYASSVGELSDSERRSTIAHLPLERLQAIELRVPALAVQRRVAADLRKAFTLIDRARDAVTCQADAAYVLKERVLVAAFKYVTPVHVGPSGRAAPPGWAWRELAAVARLESGHTPSRGRPEWWGGDVPWIALPDIRAHDGKLAYETAENTNDLGIANSSARILPAHTVVMSRTASVGFVTVMGRPMATSQDFVNWVCSPELDPFFLAYALRASRDYIRGLASGAVHKTIYMPTLHSLQVCMPDIEEQRRIVAELDARVTEADRLQTSLAARRDQIQKLPSVILRAAFTPAAAPGAVAADHAHDVLPELVHA